ncbi:hypothetical protein BDZ85DRAFT_299069 [Elsinoe ampelina]|uniref:Uncharacterized protein n=1 Tax=Elsinoe ampelina TaxID=302913 RepID=A0A6A6G0D2_9PEZI|nr:hypothetical protein BDZ85DRAFT_299069 [Elsinoe ampelina]
MARTLPWKKAASSSTPNPTRNRRPPAVSGSTTPKRRRSPARRDEQVNTTGVSTPERRARMRSGRSPSTSPPPAPPDQEPMREGYAADDIYMMVEDEFQSTAKLYTQHLHHAEYKRLQRLAREREAAAPARPPDLLGQFGIGTDGPSRKRPWRPKKDSDDEDNLAVGDPTLAGLLDSPRKQQVMLRREGVDSSSTPTSQRLVRRSPIATARPRHDDNLPAHSGATKTRRAPPPVALDGSDTDDDDLDAPVRKQEARLASRPPPAKKHQGRA